MPKVTGEALDATIHDVAETAGVSASTVSRAFGHPEKVAAKTLDRIRRAAHKVGYEPARRHIGDSKSGNGIVRIGVLLPDINNPFFVEVVEGIQASTPTESRVLLADFEEDEDKERLVIESLRQVSDRLILCSPRIPDEQIQEISKDTPIVVVNRSVPDVSCVGFDNAEVIRKAVLHLRAMGHERIGFCGGPVASHSAMERLEAFKESVRDDFDDLYIGEFPPTFSGGREAADAALNADVTAVIAYNDLVGVGIMKRMNTYGLNVPARLSIVGIDGIPLGEIVTPGLTTVSLPRVEAGKAAIKALWEEKREHISLPSSLIVRESTVRRS